MIVNLNLINKNILTYIFFYLQLKKTVSIKKNRSESSKNSCRDRNDAKQYSPSYTELVAVFFQF